MSKFYSPTEIDPDTFECVNSFESTMMYAVNRVRGVSNPYVGNKRKIIPWIIKTLDKEGVKYNSVLDLFAGSHCFSIVMKLLGKRVLCNDILVSSYVYGKAFVENNSQYLTDNDVNILCDNPEKNIDNDLIVYDRYFSASEIKQLEHFVSNLVDKYVGTGKEYLILANLQIYIMEKCYVGGRLNCGQILAEKNHRIGHAKNKGAEMSLRNMPKHEFNNPNAVSGSCAFLSDSITLLSHDIPQVDLVYIDPPYGGEQSDYSDMFDFFEVLAEKVLHKSCKNGQERFVKSSGYEKEFSILLESLIARDIPYWAFSYNDKSWAGVDKITAMIQDVGKRKHVKVYSEEYEYHYASEDNKKGIEYLILA
jgi:adenine-specific DNA-methyltransferase